MILNYVSYSIITAGAADIRSNFRQCSYWSDSEVGKNVCPETALEERIKIISQSLRRKRSLYTQTHVSNLSKSSKYFQARCFIFFYHTILVIQIRGKIVLFLQGNGHKLKSLVLSDNVSKEEHVEFSYFCLKYPKFYLFQVGQKYIK